MVVLTFFFSLSCWLTADCTVHALSEIFDRADHDNDGYVHKAELQQYLARSDPALLQCTAVKHLLQRLGAREGNCCRLPPAYRCGRDKNYG